MGGVFVDDKWGISDMIERKFSLNIVLVFLLLSVDFEDFYDIKGRFFFFR